SCGGRRRRRRRRARRVERPRRDFRGGLPYPTAFLLACSGWPRGTRPAVTVDSPERSSGRDIGVCLGALARVGSRGGGARSIFPRSPAGLRPIDRWTRPSWSARRRGLCVAAATHSAAAALLRYTVVNNAVGKGEPVDNIR